MAEDADVEIQPITRADFIPAKVFRSRSMNTLAGHVKPAPFSRRDVTLGDVDGSLFHIKI